MGDPPARPWPLQTVYARAPADSKKLTAGSAKFWPVRNRSAKAVSSLVLQSTNLQTAFYERL